MGMSLVLGRVSRLRKNHGVSSSTTRQMAWVFPSLGEFQIHSNDS